MYRIRYLTDSHAAPTIQTEPSKSISPDNLIPASAVSKETPTGAPKKAEESVMVDSTVAKIYAQTNRLTARQRDIIQGTFTQMEKNAIPNALSILIRLFSEYPNYKNIWPQFRAIPDSALICAPELRRHATVYMKGLRTIIDAMDDDTKLTASLKRIAKAHIKWNIHKSHLMHMVQPVVEVVRETNGGLMTDEIKTAWITLYDVIANLIDIYRVIEKAEQRK
ncbi:hypothetical protein L596_004961 [Steinernema carpocapsae]|uniref:Globin domain-containing protein n=1 Tax=Steinernema carpocapsae TaxID=34508 RepID=A0A4U8UYY9_STECR|nr:hypothetical protein L596_004961 [Steinernema carpocapsae]